MCRQIAFLKSSATKAAQDTARDAVQLFGGRGITQTGMGRFIEHVSTPPSEGARGYELRPVSQYHRVVPFDSLLGGGK